MKNCHIGNSSLASKHSYKYYILQNSLIFQILLVISFMSHNLLKIIKFILNLCFVSDLTMVELLLQRTRKGGLLSISIITTVLAHSHSNSTIPSQPSSSQLTFADPSSHVFLSIKCQESYKPLHVLVVVFSFQLSVRSQISISSLVSILMSSLVLGLGLGLGML